MYQDLKSASSLLSMINDLPSGSGCRKSVVFKK
jgi:hypothetical protein